MNRLSSEKREAMQSLRKQGLSIPEISERLGISKTSVQRHVLSVTVPTKYAQHLKEKQGGAKARAHALRQNIQTMVEQEFATLTERDCLLVLIGLYWGEGTKKDFNIINSDPALIQTVINSLDSLKIDRQRLTLSLRVHSGVSLANAKKFWSLQTGVPLDRITRHEVIKGKKKGKLPYGMCRLRVSTGIKERLYIQEAISLIGKVSKERVLSV
jgi:predicted DNA-binding protein YlxM (UPF0122 family)